MATVARASTTMMASVIFGFALGDPLINIFSLNGVHWAIVGLFVLASIALMFIQVPPRIEKETGSRDSINNAFHRFFDEMKDGMAFIQEHAMVRNGMLKLAVLFSGVVALCILFISFAKSFLFDDPLVAARKFAYIITYSGIGMAVGAFWVGHQFRRTQRAYLVFGGFSVIGAALLALTAITQIAKTQHVFTIPALQFGFLYLEDVHLTYRMVFTYLLAMLMGVGAAFVAIPLQAMLQELIPEDKRGKVMGVQFTLLSTSSTIPALIAGLAVEYIGVQWMFALFGLPLLLFGLFGLRQRMMVRDVPVANW